jgi:hypothetical protein
VVAILSEPLLADSYKLPMDKEAAVTLISARMLTFKLPGKSAAAMRAWLLALSVVGHFES